jgi:SagB-type dehydrogenase family enzyme
MSTPLDTVLDYHHRTKHHFHRYAAGPGTMDWANQPDPFRTFAGCPQRALPLLDAGPEAPYADLYRPGGVPPRPYHLNSLAALLELSFGLSAWKQYGGNRWALRCNPSSGNLHPTEAYVVTVGCPGLADGVHHYVSRDHLLEERCRFRPEQTEAALPAGSFLAGLSSIHWREAWKYGERAYRYCQHDAGHALAALRFAAAALGWHVRLLGDWSDAEIGACLGIDREQDFHLAERERPDLFLRVDTGAVGATDDITPQAVLKAAGHGHWQGQANRLSTAHGHDWPLIEAVAKACHKPRTVQPAWRPPCLPEPLPGGGGRTATEVIRRRRSAQAFDGVTALEAPVFYRMLDLTLPRAGMPPWDALPWAPRVHLLLFVHRVRGLPAGLYLFLRRPEAELISRRELSADFEWAPVEDRPGHLLLFRLLSADTRAAAGALGCHQEIAADSAFSLGMLGEYETSLSHGPWIYRQLFWECGMLGQVLYLEAEAAGVRGTGIGCYFDDAVHEVLGIEGSALQSLYHFTVGGALEDHRLQTLPPYAHLSNR